LYDLCCQFLWLVHFWLPLLYFLTFGLSYAGCVFVHTDSYIKLQNYSMWNCTFVMTIWLTFRRRVWLHMTSYTNVPDINIQQIPLDNVLQIII
jgi:hypothetical protein